MSRLGDLIRQERLARGLSTKQVARMGGVSEGFLGDVERGERIIADDLAARILKKMGTSDEALLPFESTVLPPDPVEAPRARPIPKPPEPVAEPSEAWMNALGGVVRAVPIHTPNMKAIGARTLATERGRIEGYPADKVLYIRQDDDGLRGLGVYQGDLVLVAPCATALEGAIQLVEVDGATGLYHVTPLEGGRALLQVFDERPAGRVVETRAARFRGKAIRIERAL